MRWLYLAVGLIAIYALLYVVRDRVEPRPPGNAPDHTATRAAARSNAAPSPTLMRWRAADGTIHIRSVTPERGHETPSDDPERAPNTARQERGSPANTLQEDPLGVYTPGGIRELRSRLDESRKRLDERKALLEALEP